MATYIDGSKLVVEDADHYAAKYSNGDTLTKNGAGNYTMVLSDGRQLALQADTSHVLTDNQGRTVLAEADDRYLDETGVQHAQGAAEKLADFEEELIKMNRKKVDEEVVEYLNYVR